MHRVPVCNVCNKNGEIHFDFLFLLNLLYMWMKVCTGWPPFVVVPSFYVCVCVCIPLEFSTNSHRSHAGTNRRQYEKMVRHTLGDVERWWRLTTNRKRATTTITVATTASTTAMGDNTKCCHSQDSSSTKCESVYQEKKKKKKDGHCWCATHFSRSQWRARATQCRQHRPRYEHTHESSIKFRIRKANARTMNRYIYSMKKTRIK